VKKRKRTSADIGRAGGPLVALFSFVEHERALDGLDTSDPNAVRSVAKLEADIAVAENEVTLLEAMVPKAGR
jgi:hypothetical protein